MSSPTPILLNEEAVESAASVPEPALSRPDQPHQREQSRLGAELFDFATSLNRGIAALLTDRR